MTLRLRTVIALDDDEVDRAVWLPHLDVGLIFQRTIAGERRGVVGEFDHDVARTGGTFHTVEFAAANHVAAAECLEDRGVGRRIGLKTLFVVHIDPRDPITLRHLRSPFIIGLLLRFLRRWLLPRLSDRPRERSAYPPPDSRRQARSRPGAARP